MRTKKPNPDQIIKQVKRNGFNQKVMDQAKEQFPEPPQDDTSLPPPSGQARSTTNGLTYKQERFCQYIALEGLTLSDAYRKAFNPPNSSEKTINESASRLHKQSKIIARLAKYQREQDEGRSIEPLAIKQFVVRNLMDMVQDTKVRPADKNKALELLGKVAGADMFKENQKQSEGNTKSNTGVAELMKRIEALAGEKAKDNQAPVDTSNVSNQPKDKPLH